MATFLDAGIMQSTNNIMVVLFIFIFFYAILSRLKFGSQFVNMFISFVLAFIVGLYEPARIIISFAAPWFTMLMIFLFFILLLILLFGVKIETVASYLSIESGARPFIWVIIIVGLFIIAFSFGQVENFSYQGEQRPAVEDDGKTSVKDILFHPAVLGILTLLLIAAFAMMLITSG